MVCVYPARDVGIDEFNFYAYPSPPPLAVNNQLPPHLTSPVTRWGTPQTCVQSFSLLLADRLKHAKSLLFTPPNTRTHDRHFDLYLHKAFLSFYILHGFPFCNASLVKITSNQTIYFSTLGARFFLNLILHITTMFLLFRCIFIFRT